MAALHRIYERLRQIPDASVDHSLASALGSADPQATRLIVETLLQRPNSPGLPALIVHYHLFTNDLQHELLERIGDLYRPLREAASLKDTAGPSNALTLIERSRSVQLVYLVVEQLAVGASERRAEAARTLLHLCQYVAALPAPVESSPPARKADEASPGKETQSDDHPAGSPATGWVEPADGRLLPSRAGDYLIAALGEALHRFGQHHQNAAILAVATLAPRPMPALTGMLADPHHPAHDPLRRMLLECDAPVIRRSLLFWAGIPGVSDYALAGIARCAGGGQFADFLPQWHLLAQGSMPALLRRLPDASLACPTLAQIAALPGEAARGVPAWIERLDLTLAQRVEALRQVRASSDPPARLATLRRLIALACEATSGNADDIIAQFAADADLPLARIAVRHLVRVRWPGLTRLLLSLVHSPHADLRQIAGTHLKSLAFERVWEAWPKLDAPQQLGAGRALIKLDPNFLRLLAERLALPDRVARLRALHMIRVLHQTFVFEAAILALADDPDETIASAAVHALGSARTPAALTRLEAALRHPDSRVRANAVEALQQLNAGRHVQQLAEMARTDDNRPRANAIRALMDMRLGEALQALADMLNDVRPEHRVSALWLVDQLQILEMARHVAELAVTDQDAPVRRRARDVVGRLLQVLRQTPPDTPMNHAAATA